MNKLFVMKFVLFTFVVNSTISISAPFEDSIKLQVNEKVVEIPLRGMQSNKEAIALANSIRKAQRESKKWLRLHNGKVDPTIELLLVELQKQAIIELENGYQTVANTSSGRFPAKSKSGVQRNVQKLNLIVSYRGSLNKLVETKIDASDSPARIHYKPFADRNNNWSSYTKGQRMKIGGYYFRVFVPGNSAFEELVVVINDPHHHTLIRL